MNDQRKPWKKGWIPAPGKPAGWKRPDTPAGWSLTTEEKGFVCFAWKGVPGKWTPHISLAGGFQRSWRVVKHGHRSEKILFAGPTIEACLTWFDIELEVNPEQFEGGKLGAMFDFPMSYGGTVTGRSYATSLRDELRTNSQLYDRFFRGEIGEMKGVVIHTLTEPKAMFDVVYVDEVVQLPKEVSDEPPRD